MLDIRQLIWEPEVNVAHIRDKHGLTQDEVEEACQGAATVEEGYAGRVRLVAPTRSGRMLAVVLAPRPDVGEGFFYPVTARPASRQERRRYRQARGGEE